LSTNPRLVKEALALKSAGFEVTVVHGSFKAWGVAADHAIAAEIGSTCAVPFGPVEATRARYLRQTLVRRTAHALVGRGAGAQPIVEAAHSPIMADLASATLQVRADLYIAHYVASLPAASRAAERYGTQYAFDAEDFHLGDLPDTPKHSLDKKIIRAIEGRYLPGAAYVTAASPMIADAYAETYNIPLPTTVLNVFPTRNAPSGPTLRGTVAPGPSVYWFSQTIGPGRGLETAIEAIARAKSRPHLYLRGAPAGCYASEMRQFAAKIGVAERLHLLEPAAPDELERLGATYDLGYVGELAQTKNRQIAITNKLFSYILGGLPSLASDIPSHCRIATDLGLATSIFPIGNAAALADAFDSLLLDPPRLAAARAHAWWLGQNRYNWEAEAPVFLERVQSLLDRNISCPPCS
jgi:glycosyltransferase involved in cell wall biosynthesis